MRIIAFILSIYILVLTGTPCYDKPMNRISHQTEVFSANHSSHSDNCDPDECSPFCSCNCCATPVIYMDAAIHLQCYYQLQTQELKYKPALVSAPSHHIWQPPKFC